MPPLSAPPRNRVAAVQSTAVGASAAITRSSGSTFGAVGALDPRYLARSQEWQDWARRYVKTIGAARFAAGIVSDSSARCELIVEERNGAAEWEQTSDQRLTGVFDAYRNERQDAPELVRAHAWHYWVSGEMCQVMRDGPSGVDWSLFSVRAIDFDKPTKGMCRVKLTPNGNENEETAYVVPREYVTRFWTPDEEWQGYATSPMAAGIADLRRYDSLARYVRRTAESYLAMGGVLFTPGEAHDDFKQKQQAAAGAGKPQTTLDEQYYELAKIGLGDDDDVASIAPPSMHWKHEWGKPEWVKIGEGLDPKSLEHMDDALKAFARGLPIPTIYVTAGGPGEANHWGDWKAAEEFVDKGVKPVMDTITHHDLTQTFLRPFLRLNRLPEDRFRVGFDATPIIVKPDQSEHSLQLHLAGLLSDEATLEAAGFDPVNDVMKSDQLATLLEVLSRGAAGTATSPVIARRETISESTPTSPANVAKIPPANAPPTLPKAAAAGTEQPTAAKASRLLAKITKIRQAAGRKVLAFAEQAFADAVEHAGTKIVTRAKSTKRAAAVVAAVAEAVEQHQPLRQFYAAVGITEKELIAKSFNGLETTTQTALVQTDAQIRTAITDAGLDPNVYLGDSTASQDRAAAAAAFLIASLTALAYQRLSDGPLVPAAGEVTGSVPGSLAGSTLRVLTGGATVTLPESPDAGLETRLGNALTGTPVEYTWEWGFYGDPTTPFAPHEDLSGLTTQLPGGDLTDEADPDLANSESFPEVDYFWPGDHDGCSCEWVPSIIEAGS